jgi:hypothetical protein
MIFPSLNNNFNKRSSFFQIRVFLSSTISRSIEATTTTIGHHLLSEMPSGSEFVYSIYRVAIMLCVMMVTVSSQSVSCRLFNRIQCGTVVFFSRSLTSSLLSHGLGSLYLTVKVMFDEWRDARCETAISTSVIRLGVR